MKYKALKSILLKSCTVVISFVTAGTMTACTLSFQGHGSDISGDIAKEAAAASEEIISVEIDNTDFSSEEELNSLTEKITVSAKELSENSEILGDFTAASLIRVVDGDTIVVEIDGDEYKVRLIGVDTPESVASDEYLAKTGKENTDAGIAASDFTKELLSSYDTVYLVQDISNTDQYGRLLRYVWLEMPNDAYDLSEISTKMLNGILLERGYAEIATYEPDTEYEMYFEEIADAYEYD